MKQVVLPGTELRTSALGLGTWGLGGENDVDGTACGWRDIATNDALIVIYEALECGITFFDTADFYGLGRSEELLGLALRGHDDVVVATKVGILPRMRPGTDDLARDFSNKHIETSVNASLRRMGRDRIDLLQLHGPDLGVLDADETWNALNRQVEAGKVRYLGVSLKSGLSALHRQTWCDDPRVSVVQSQYSLLDPREMARMRSVPRTRAVLGRSLFAHGMLFGQPNVPSEPSDHRMRKWTGAADRVRRVNDVLIAHGIVGAGDARRAVLAHAILGDSIDVAIVGATTGAQVRENALVAAKANEYTKFAAAMDDVLQTLIA